MVYIYVFIGVIVFGYVLGRETKETDDDVDSALWAAFVAIICGFIWPFPALLGLLIGLGRFGRYVNRKLE